MENFKSKWMEVKTTCFDGEVTVKKTELWLVMTICLLVGIIYGLRKAPMTHGVTIGCNNGNSCGYETGCAKRKERKEDEEAREKEEGKEKVKGKEKLKKKKK